MIVIDCDCKGDESNILVTFLRKWTIRVNMVTKYHEMFGSKQMELVKSSVPDHESMICIAAKDALKLSELQKKKFEE